MKTFFVRRQLSFLKALGRTLVFKVKKSGAVGSPRFAVEPKLFINIARVWDREQREFIRFFLKAPLDRTTVREVFTERAYTFEGLFCEKFALNYSRGCSRSKGSQGPLIIDCGANIGASSVLFSKLYPNARILAIEPDSRNTELFRANSSQSNIALIEAAVSSSSEGVVFKSGSNPRSGRVLSAEDCEPTGGVSVKSVSIDELLLQYEAWFPFIVKIDIEGFEKDLFAKNIDWVSRVPIIIIELHDWLYPLDRPADNFISKIARMDRLFCTVGENVISIDRASYFHGSN